MTSFIIVAKTEEKQQEITKKLCDERNIDTFDRTLITLPKETSIGIDVVKKLQLKVLLKPLRGKDKAVIIPQAELLTIPAQNALLKLLEEPPEHTLLFLLTTSLDALLPTIQSRCRVIQDKEGEVILNDEDKQSILKEYSLWETLDFPSALKLAEQYAKDKDTLLPKLQKIIQILHGKLEESVYKEEDVISLSKRLQKLQETYVVLEKTNTNPRLVLEHLFLSLSI